MSYWPPALPDPQTGNAFTTAEKRITTDGEVAQRERVIDPNYRQTATLSWTFSEQQFRVFEAWHRWYLHDGISRFSVSWNDRRGWARFTGAIDCKLSGATWSVSGEAVIDYAHA